MHIAKSSNRAIELENNLKYREKIRIDQLTSNGFSFLEGLEIHWHAESERETNQANIKLSKARFFVKPEAGPNYLRPNLQRDIMLVLGLKTKEASKGSSGSRRRFWNIVDGSLSSPITIKPKTGKNPNKTVSLSYPHAHLHFYSLTKPRP